MEWNFDLMKKNYIILFAIFLSMTLVAIPGCQPLTEVTPTQPVTLEQPLPTSPTTEYNLPVVMAPAVDKAIVCGRVVQADGTPLGNLNIRLAEVYYGESNSDGAFVLNTSSSPSAMTDEVGYFCTTEITVTNYVLIIGNPEENYEIYAGEDAKAMVWSPSAGEILDIGEVITSLDPDL